MPVQNFEGDTFVAFTDISGFKELMKDNVKGLNALRIFYQAGYDALRIQNGVEGFFVSDCGILFARVGTHQERLSNILLAVKTINRSMLQNNFMLTTSIAYGHFNYHDKLEFDGIEKNPIYGNAYVQAFLDNETGTPRIQPGQCRLMMQGMPVDIDINSFELLHSKRNNNRHMYYYWNLESRDEINHFENNYNDSYKLKYSGMLTALKNR